jgi:hypothetical protein
MKELISPIVSEMSDVGKAQSKFLETLFPTILATRGAVNFRNLSRYSYLSEKTYSRQFANSFDFMAFNRRLIDDTFSQTGERVELFDASFIKKAGKHTYGLGYFYNGCNSRPEKGLEISSFAICDLSYHTALTLSVQQTEAVAQKRSQMDEETMIDQYISHIKAVHPHLHAHERHLSLDGNFAKIKVFDALSELGITGITRLRSDANMRYFYEGPKREKGSGKQKVYDGKVDWSDLSRFEYMGEDHGCDLYTLILNHPYFKRTFRVVVIVDPSKDKHNHVILASTDKDMDAWTIVRYYRARFQIEFIYRDGKQHTGLSDAQVRDKDRLDFHFNASLTTLNLAKAEQISTMPMAEPFVFSMQSVKARYFNEYYLNQFFSLLGLDAELIKKSPQYQCLCNYGAIAV